MLQPFKLSSHLLQAAALCAAVLFAPLAAAAANIEEQRELFMAVYPEVELGNWEAVTDLPARAQGELADYVLWPDLRAAYLRRKIRSVASSEIEPFLQQFGALKPGRELRYRYALELVRRNDLPAFHEIYVSFYQGRGIAQLDCLALEAEIDSGLGERIASRARALWRVGKSQVDECDPVFAYLKDTGQLGPREYRERYELAIEARNFSLARWLGKSIDDEHVAHAQTWLDAQTDPAGFLRQHTANGNTPATAEQLAYAAERLTYNDPLAAHALWTTALATHSFTEQQEHDTARHIALWTARDNLPGAYERLTELAPGAVDREVRRWRARSSLRRLDWKQLLADIEQMTDTEKNAEEWRYWRAVAQRETGNELLADAAFTALATERSYYGFLAADALGKPYAFAHNDLAADETALAAIASRAPLVRARELFMVGLESRGRSEWDAATDQYSAEEKMLAAVLANRWGWHSRAIATAASAGAYDDLSLRYPLPYQDSFLQHSNHANIPSTWAYGIARSESLFMPDIRSSAGAIGLMQLMPATGRDVARQIKLPFSGVHTLTNPVANIRLGTTYLAWMAERFGGNRVLATAAYNAGPHRVDQWIPADDAVDARIWIENIPYNETRKYVRRVLAAETIFHWRLTGETQRLSDELLVVEPKHAAQRVASSSR